MPKIKQALIISIVLAVLALATYGISIVKQSARVADDITLDEIKDCETVFWNETENIYGTCTHEYSIRKCDDEPINNSCHIVQESKNYECITGYNTSAKSKEICKDKEMRLLAGELSGGKKYRLTYGDWGKCGYLPGTDSVIITCDSKNDGNEDGICQPGESCVSFIVSKNRIERFFRNSRADFTSDDPTFYQDKLTMEEEE